MRLGGPFVALFLACSAGFFQTATAFAIPWPSFQGRGIIQPRAPPVFVVDAVPTPTRPEDQRTAVATIIGGIRGSQQEDAVSTSAAIVIDAIPTPVATVIDAAPSPPRPEDQRTAVATIIGGIRGQRPQGAVPTPVATVIDDVPSPAQADDQRTAVATVIGGIKARPIPGFRIGAIRPGPPPPPPEPTPPPPPPAPEVPKTDPMEPPGGIICEPPATGDFFDSHEFPMFAATSFFCEKFASPRGEHDPAKMLPITANIYHFSDEFGPWDLVRHNDNAVWDNGFLKYFTPSQREDHGSMDVYNFTISRVEGCELRPGGRWNFTEPVKGELCGSMFPMAWRQCQNLGRGGGIQAGCLWYHMRTLF